MTPSLPALMREDVARWVHRGFRAVEAHDLPAAGRAAKRLQRLGHPYGDELHAVVLVQSGKRRRAIKALTAALGKHADEWRLWLLLGNVRAEGGDFAGAHLAFGRALSCHGVDRDLVRVDMALALAREGRRDDALACLDEVAAGWLAASALRASLLGEADEPRADAAATVAAPRAPVGILAQAAAHAAERATAGLLPFGDDAAPDAVPVATVASAPATAAAADAEVEAGVTAWRAEASAERAIAHARAALAQVHGHAGALRLLREVHDQRSRRAVWMRVVVQGVWSERRPGDVRPPSFLEVCDVVADGPEEALQLVAALEPEAVRPSLRLEACRVLRTAPGELKGVHARSDYGFAAEGPGE